MEVGKSCDLGYWMFCNMESSSTATFDAGMKHQVGCFWAVLFTGYGKVALHSPPESHII